MLHDRRINWTVTAIALGLALAAPALGGSLVATPTASVVDGALLPSGATVSLIGDSSALGAPVVGSSQAPEPVGGSSELAISPELYGLAAARGSVVMDGAAGGGVATAVDLTDVHAKAPGIIGFPNVRYGYNPFCGSGTSAACETSTASALPLPERISALPPIAVSTEYSTEVPAGAPVSVDVAFDLWLTAADRSVRAGPGDVELMVWLYYSNGSLLPAGLARSADDPVDVPVEVNGSWATEPFLWATGTGSDGWTIVYLIDAVDRPTASLTIDLSAALAAVPAVLYSGGGVGGSAGTAGLYLEGIALGSEFRVPTAGASADYSWTLNELTLGIGPGSLAGSIP